MRIGQQLGLVLAASLCACGGGTGYGPGRIEDEVSGGRSPLEAPLALGATYRPELKLELKGIGTPALFLDSGQPNVVAIETESLKGVAPGLAPILIKTREGIVLDFFHVWVEQPTRLAVHRFTLTGADSGEVTARLDVMVGESVTLAPRIYSGSQRLAGSATTQWDVEPPHLQVLYDGTPERRRLLAKAPGAATLTITTAGTSTTVALNVVGRQSVMEGMP